jgi:hypothetical protein
MFREALDYPTRPPHGGRAVLVGGTLLLLAELLGVVATLEPYLAPAALLALLPWLALRGYHVRVLRTTIGREFPTPPSFRGAGVRSLLADGLKATLVAAGYLLPGAVVLAPLGYARTREMELATLLLGEGASSAVASAVTSVAGVLALLAVLYLIGAAYALPVAVSNFAYTGRLREAFDLRTVVDGAATEDYVVAWVVSLLLQAVILPAAYLLKVLVMGFYIQFLVSVGVRYCYGQGVGAALGLEPLEPAFGDVGPETASESGAPTPAVRPLEESEAPELRSVPSDTTGEDAEEPPGSEWERT